MCMKFKKFILNGMFLVVTAIVTQTIGTMFRIYMSNTIGAKAIGLYQLIITVYAFAITTTVSGITLLVTRLVSQSIALNKTNCIRYIVLKCTAIALIISLFTGGLLFFGSNFIAEHILCQKETALPLKILAPSLPFIAVSSSLRGYFSSVRQAYKSAIEQLLEQVTEISVFMLLIGKFVTMGIEYSCCAIAIGSTVSEIVTALYSFILYRLDSRKYSKSGRCSIRKSLYFIGIPVTLSSCLRSGLNIIENVTIPKGLRLYGKSSESALTDYGIIMGMVMPFIGFPAIVIYSFATILIPEMSEVYERTDTKKIQYIASNAVRIVLLFSLPLAVILFFFGKEIGVFFYHNAETGRYIHIFSLIVPLIYLDKIVDSMLKGLNQQIAYLSYNIIDSVVSVIFVIVLIPHYGVFGLIVTMYFSTFINTGLSLLRLIKVTEIQIKALWITAPLFISILLCYIIRMLFVV